MLSGIGVVQAAVPIPSGFQLISSDTGVRVYQKNYSGGQPDYVIIVDLRYATLRNFTGRVSGPSGNALITRRLLSSYWNDAVAQNTSTRKIKVGINGTFFDPNNDPTGISFGLKADRWLMSYGYGINEPGTKYTLAYDSDYKSSSIQTYSRSIFDGSIPNVIGGYDPNYDKDGKKNSNIQRTFVGVRDDNNDGHSETVIFYASKYATQPWAINILNSFGAGSKMMLDGGGSTCLTVDGTPKISTTRPIPQAFMIYSGK